MKKRDVSVDLMKGFAILLVLLGHRFMTNTIQGAHHPTCEIIYSFHMSFFFFISGYVNEISGQLKRKNASNFLRDKIRTILYPYLIWTLLGTIYSTYNIGVGGLIKEFVHRLNFYPEAVYWFLPLLFIFFCIYIIDNKVFKWAGVSMCLMLIFLGVFFKQIFLIYYAFYLLSFLFGGWLHSMNIKKYVEDKRIYGFSAVILLILWMLFPLNSSYSKFLNLIVKLPISILSCIVFFNFFKSARLPIFLKRYLSEIGQYTIVLYLLPILLLPPRTFLLPDGLTFVSENLIILFVGVIHSLISYAIGRVVFEIPYLRLFLFGKR